MWISTKLFFTIGIIVCIHFLAKAQPLTTAEQKANLLFQMAEELKWPKNAKKDTFEIAIFDEDLSIFSPLERLSSEKRIHNRPVLILIYSYPYEITNPNILYASIEFSSKLESISREIGSKPILLISDHASNLKDIQIDLLETDERVGFRFNASNIELKNISNTVRLTNLGGKPLRLEDVYVETVNALKVAHNQNVELQKEIERLSREMLEQTKKLGQNKLSISDQTEKINEQIQHLADQQDTLDDQFFRVQELRRAIVQKEDSLSKTSKALINQRNNLKHQQRRAKRYDKILSEKKREIALQESRIKEQSKVLVKKEEKIETQQYYMYFGAMVLLLFLGFLFVIWRSNVQRKAANALLQEKNFAISKQNREIQKQKEEIGRNHEQIQSSLRYATTIQQAILPSPRDLAVLSNFIIFKPKDLVSGDFYWKRTLIENDQKVHFFAAVDCTGHGVPGAFMSMIANRILNEIVTAKGVHEPEEILEILDTSVKESLRQHENQNRDGMDVCLVKIYETDNEETEIVFAGAKRPLYIYDLANHKLSRITGSRRGIAGSHVKQMFGPFVSNTISLQKGDTIYLTSDGFPDQNNEARKRFGSNQLQQLLLEIGNQPMQVQKERLETELATFQGSAAQRDDITLIGIRI